MVRVAFIVVDLILGKAMSVYSISIIGFVWLESLDSIVTRKRMGYGLHSALALVMQCLPVAFRYAYGLWPMMCGGWKEVCIANRTTYIIYIVRIEGNYGYFQHLWNNGITEVQNCCRNWIAVVRSRRFRNELWKFDYRDTGVIYWIAHEYWTWNSGLTNGAMIQQ